MKEVGSLHRRPQHQSFGVRLSGFVGNHQVGDGMKIMTILPSIAMEIQSSIKAKRE